MDQVSNNEAPVVLRVQNVGKKYIIKNVRKLPPDATRAERIRFHISKFKKNDFWALKDINFELRRGEQLAIIGRNGAGKSTLLKLISRITEPTEGRIEYYGRVAAMLEVGTGFNQELTGRENVYLNGAILGITKAEIDERFDSIVEFAEVEQFIDTPIKRYSSGMMVRLAFAVASTLDPDILIIDEVLSVGDMKFREKCLQRMNDIARSGKTILCVSHVMGIVRGLCNRAIVLDHGKMIYDGEVEHAIKLYNGIYDSTRVTHRDLDPMQRTYKWINGKIRMTSLDVLGNDRCIYEWNEPIHFMLRIRADDTVQDLNARAVFRADNGASAAAAFVPMHICVQAGETKDLEIEIRNHNLAPGDYKVELDLTENQPYDSYNEVDVIMPEAFFITVRNYGSGQHSVADDEGRLWKESWGYSRIMDSSFQVHDV